MSTPDPHADELATMEPQLRALARRYERGRLDPARSFEDMLQEAKIGALLGLRGYSEGASEASREAYGVICASRACVRELRRAHATDAVSHALRESPSDAHTLGAEDEALGRIRRREILSGERMSPAERRALVLRLAGWRAPEIARALGIKARSAQSAVARARKKAREVA